MNRNISYIYALIAILFWSTVATAFKLALIKLDIFALVLSCSLTSLIIFFVYLALNKNISGFFKQTFNDHKKSMVLGFLNPFIYYLILFKAYKLLPAQLAQPLNMVWPITLVLISSVLLKQKITQRNIIALIICFGGVILISMKDEFSFFSNVNKTGVFLALFSSVIWSFYWVYNLKDKRSDTLKLTLNFFYSTIYAIIAFIIFSETRITISKSLLAAVYSGFFEMGITFLLWFKALEISINVSKISVLVYIAPVLSLFFIRNILNETIYYTTIAGITLIICGIIFDKWFVIFVKK